MNDAPIDPAQLLATELVLHLREELKQRWRAGSPVRVEDLLAKSQGKIADEGILDLIYQEIVLREEAGEQPTLDEYRQRFPLLDDSLQRQFALHEILNKSMLDSGAASTSATVTINENTPLAAAPSSPGTADSPSCPMPIIPGYEILAEIGRGGMGVVYQARQVNLERTVALKMVLHGEYASPDARRRFRTEAAAVARIQHPHIVQIIEIGEQDGRLYFSLEYCSGGSLAAKLNGKQQPSGEAARLVGMLARAVHAIHQQQIVHRDLKPANVLLTADGQPKITDFGLARRLDEEGRTQTGAVMGTPSYMSPEQARGETKQVGPAADIYALGAILYECLTGRPPFFAANTLETLHQVIENDPASPRSFNPHIDRDMETVCLKCLEKEPVKRYASAEELAEDLERWLRGESVRARPVSSLDQGIRWARRRPTLATCLVLLLMAVIGAVSLWSWGDRHRTAATRAERERAEIQQFMEALSPQQLEVMMDYKAWMKKRPDLKQLTFGDTLALFRQDHPEKASLIRAVPRKIRDAPAETVFFTPTMYGD